MDHKDLTHEGWPDYRQELTDFSGIAGFKRIIFVFDVLYSGWECDEFAWLIELEDGSKHIAETSHGGKPYIAKRERFEEKLAEYRTAEHATVEALLRSTANGTS